MEAHPALYITYIIFGLILAIFNRFFGLWVYRLTLVFTDKLHISDMFIFRIDKKNRDSFYFLMRSFCILFGLMLSFSAIYVFLV